MYIELFLGAHLSLFKLKLCAAAMLAAQAIT